MGATDRARRLGSLSFFGWLGQGYPNGRRIHCRQMSDHPGRSYPSASEVSGEIVLMSGDRQTDNFAPLDQGSRANQTEPHQTDDVDVTVADTEDYVEILKRQLAELEAGQSKALAERDEERKRAADERA